MLALSDSVLVQLISTIGTIATVIITNRRSRKRARKEHDETQTKLDKLGRALAPELGTFADFPKKKPRFSDRD